MSGKPVDRSFSIDDEIEERLKKLKDDRPDPSVADQKAIEERLARLKGIDPNHYSMPPITVYQKTNHKTDVECADDLMKQLAEELVIDDSSRRVSFGSNRRSSTDEEIERRLARLRGQQFIDQKKNISSFMDIDSDLDEETEQNNLIERLLSENSLPSIPNDGNNLETAEDNVEMMFDTLPWCNICNEDGVVRCIDCLGDIFCKQCFVDFHDDPELRKHKTEPFRPKNPRID